jgi:murein L,D-transpeptidase YcbB/YkuD
MSRAKLAAASAILLLLFAAGWFWAAAAFRFRVNPDVQLDRLSGATSGFRVPGSVRLDVRAFYDSRDLAPAWVTERAPAARVEAALQLLDAAASHGLHPDDYAAQTLRADRDRLSASGDSPSDAVGLETALLDFDVRLTSALLALGHDVAVGKTPPADFDPLWRSRRDPPNLPQTLARAIDTGLDTWLDEIAPRHAEYHALEAALADPDRLAATGRDDAAAVIAANMERWRWVPDNFGDRHVLVNIPSFTLTARRSGAADLTMRVVVGKPVTNETPILSSEISSLVFSPSWNLPASIVAKETVPAQLRDPGYLEKHGIEALRPGANGFVRVDPAALRTASASELKRMLYRQRPGPDNALGQVKFPFPNEHDVYLHDTPSDGAFGRVMRALSHGCVRLERPDLLAAYALAGEDGWTEARIRRAMDSGREQFVKLPAPVRVHLVYFTVSVDADGTLVFLPDIYRLDSRVPRPTTISNSAFVTG